MAENDDRSKKTYPGLPGGRTYYVSIPIRPLTGEVAEEHLERLTLYYTVYGLVFAVMGVIAILGPLLFSIEVLHLLAWLLVLGGAVTLLQFVLICGAPGTTSFLLLGAIHLASGLFILLQPDEANKRFIFFFSAWFLVNGIIKLMMSCQVRAVTTWPAVFASGLASIALSVVALLIGNKFGFKLIAIFFGADLVATGLALLLISCMAYLGRGVRAVSDLDARHEPLMGGRGPPAAALNV
jgi:uncharacterized membrane protein HdeD (DUF308 family)